MAEGRSGGVSYAPERESARYKSRYDCRLSSIQWAMEPRSSPIASICCVVRSQAWSICVEWRMAANRARPTSPLSIQSYTSSSMAWQVATYAWWACSGASAVDRREENWDHSRVCCGSRGGGLAARRPLSGSSGCSSHSGASLRTRDRHSFQMLWWTDTRAPLSAGHRHWQWQSVSGSVRHRGQRELEALLQRWRSACNPVWSAIARWSFFASA
mmetsp:Transcript_60027/g.159573  ORF Transcript_60027/g.159573 Transcript_60027/m.159573 type:complete len:214 (-) Transcript_60027:920-1561(-)